MSGAGVLVYEDDPERALSAAVAALNAGECIVYPTDTVYGLLARCDSFHGYREIFRLKSRPADQLLAVLVHYEHPSAQAALAELQAYPELAEHFRLGTLTAVLDPAPAGIPAAALDIQPGSLGLRCPADARTRALLSACAVPLWATSVNRTGDPPAATADEVSRWLGTLPGGADLLTVLSAGALPGSASAVVKLTRNGPVALR